MRSMRDHLPLSGKQIVADIIALHIGLRTEGEVLQSWEEAFDPQKKIERVCAQLGVPPPERIQAPIMPVHELYRPYGQISCRAAKNWWIKDYQNVGWNRHLARKALVESEADDTGDTVS